jgi:hypothetical protein
MQSPMCWRPVGCCADLSTVKNSVMLSCAMRCCPALCDAALHDVATSPALLSSAGVAILCFSNLACTMLHAVLCCVLCPVLSRPLADRVIAEATVLSHTAQRCPTLRYALRSYIFCPARWFVLTKMTGLMAEAPSGTHDISLTSSFCMVGRCCSSSTVLQSFSLIGAAALGPAPVAPP